MEKKVQAVKFVCKGLFNLLKLALGMLKHNENFDFNDKDNASQLSGKDDKHKSDDKRTIEVEPNDLSGKKERRTIEVPDNCQIVTMAQVKEQMEKMDKTANVDISSERAAMREFDQIARKHDIKYAIDKPDPKSDKTEITFFAKDMGKMNTAFKEFAAVQVKKLEKQKEKPTLNTHMDKAKSKMVDDKTTDRVRRDRDAR